MPRIDVVNKVDVVRSFRVEQMAGMFDVPIEEKSQNSFSVEVPGLDEDWQIGLIVGPSGSGKTSVAKQAYGIKAMEIPSWDKNKAVIDCFGDMSIKDVTMALSSVGFSSPPAWLRPHWALSNGEQFRCNVARLLAGESPLVVIDEFTSVVDRTVAKIGSAAVSKVVRRKPGRRLVAASCHYDIVQWLEPDWVVDMATCQLARGRLCRPKITVRIQADSIKSWPLFRQHHYLSGSIHQSARCFTAWIEKEPCGFFSIIPVFGYKGRWRGHRHVVLPDFQGVGIGSRAIEFVASLLVREGKRYSETTSNPALISHRQRHPNMWKCTHYGMFMNSASSGRLSTSWEYIKNA